VRSPALPSSERAAGTRRSICGRGGRLDATRSPQRARAVPPIRTTALSLQRLSQRGASPVNAGALVLGAVKVNSQRRPPVRDGGGHSDYLGAPIFLRRLARRRVWRPLKAPRRTSTRHLFIVHSTGAVRGRRARVAMRNRPESRAHEYGKTFEESRTKSFGARPARGARPERRRISTVWLSAGCRGRRRPGSAAGVTGMEGINYVTARRAVPPLRTPCHRSSYPIPDHLPAWWS